MQLKSTKIQEILAYINRAMSQYVPLLNKLIDECAATKQLAEQKIHALGLMVEPCRLLETTELASIPFNLIRIIQIIRYLSIHTIFSKSEREVTRLFAFLSNQLIVICASRLNIDELLRDPDSRASIQLCNVMIDCCVSYKIIVVEMERDFNAKDPAHLWRLNHDAMFHQIDGFLNRLYDVIDILEATIVYGRHDESNERPKIIFGCNNGSVYESLYAEMQKRFATNLDIIQGVAHKILNIHDDSWFGYICKFHEVNDELEKMAQFIIENSLTCTSNIEEVLEVLTTLIHFTNKESLQVIYEKKVLEVLEMFALEITKTEFDVKKENLNYYPPFMPKNAGKALIVIARSNRLLRLKKLVEFFEYIPGLELSEVVSFYIHFYRNFVKFPGFRSSESVAKISGLLTRSSVPPILRVDNHFKAFLTTNFG
jgi:Dynein heavy chain, N-terminal region 1